MLVYRDKEKVAEGAGIVMGRSGHVLTSGAVLDAGEHATVVAQGQAELTAEILLKDEASGLGLLRVEGLRLPGLPLFVKTPAPQTPIFVVVRRSRTGLPDFVRGTVIKNLTRSAENTKVRFMRHGAMIAPRAYGSPVVDECGRLVGLNIPDPDTFAIFTPTHKFKPKKSVFALRAQEIAIRLERRGIPFSLATIACVSIEDRARADTRKARTQSAADKAIADAARRRSARLRRLAIWGRIGWRGAAVARRVLVGSIGAT